MRGYFGAFRLQRIEKAQNDACQRDIYDGHHRTPNG
jgi:hypothetical protein